MRLRSCLDFYSFSPSCKVILAIQRKIDGNHFTSVQGCVIFAFSTFFSSSRRTLYHSVCDSFSTRRRFFIFLFHPLFNFTSFHFYTKKCRYPRPYETTRTKEREVFPTLCQVRKKYRYLETYIFGENMEFGEMSVV